MIRYEFRTGVHVTGVGKFLKPAAVVGMAAGNMGRGVDGVQGKVGLPKSCRQGSRPEDPRPAPEACCMHTTRQVCTGTPTSALPRLPHGDNALFAEKQPRLSFHHQLPSCARAKLSKLCYRNRHAHSQSAWICRVYPRTRPLQGAWLAPAAVRM